MKEKTKKIDCGVIIGRFQINVLHDAHVDLIQTVCERHDRVIIFLGNAPVRNTINNPLDIRARKAMILEKFPHVEVFHINDHKSDAVWSKNLDMEIAEQLLPMQTVALYGSRDSFLKSYTGKYPTCQLESNTFISATEVRRKIINNHPPTADYRAGMIAATAARYPIAYQTVDIAVVSEERKILLARKPDEKLFRFIGGFSDPRSNSLEIDARREVSEEASIEVDDIRYIGSTVIDDPRYRNEVDKIKTALFVAKYTFGKPEGADDVAEVGWFDISGGLDKNIIEPVHHVLVDIFNEKFCGNRELQDRYFRKNVDGRMT